MLPKPKQIEHVGSLIKEQSCYKDKIVEDYNTLKQKIADWNDQMNEGNPTATADIQIKVNVATQEMIKLAAEIRDQTDLVQTLQKIQTDLILVCVSII